jgi:hypothetical protein
MNFTEMRNNIDTILGYDQRECGKVFYPESGTFEEWRKLNKLKIKDREGKHFNSSQIYYSWYKMDIINGKWIDTPYCDFWHWMLDNCFNNNVFRNDTNQRLYLGNEVDFDHDWQRVIYKVWQDTYKHLADEDGFIDVFVSW